MEVTTHGKGGFTIKNPDSNVMQQMIVRTLWKSLRRMKLSSVVPSDVRENPVLYLVCRNTSTARFALNMGVEMGLFSKKGRRYLVEDAACA
jgi:hypothetical protein